MRLLTADPTPAPDPGVAALDGPWRHVVALDGRTALPAGAFEQVAATAGALAAFAHHGQVDKIGRPYLEHPAAVAGLLVGSVLHDGLDRPQQQVAVVVAWLHDVVEDTPVSAEVLRALGWQPAVVDGVLLLTRVPDRTAEADAAYYAAILADPVARAVKVADIAHNTSPSRRARLSPDEADRLATKYGKALTVMDAHDLVPSGS